jgi:spoIIIJ-associated protein
MESEVPMVEKIEKAVTTLATMLDYLGLNADVKGEEKNGRIIIKISSENAGRIIGRKGQTLESLQFLLNRMMLKTDTVFPRIYMDVDGYSKSGTGRGDRRRDGDDRNRGYASKTERPRHSAHETDDENRDETLKQQAIDAAKEVKRWGETVTLPPMNSHERRVIHMALENDLEIITDSVEGDNPKMKSVIVRLKGSKDKQNSLSLSAVSADNPENKTE